MSDPRARAFFDTLNERMKTEGFVLYRETYPCNVDEIILFYHKPIHNKPTAALVVAVAVSGLDILQTDPVTLANSRADAAIKTYVESELGITLRASES